MKIWNTSRSKENSLSRAESPRAAEEGIQTHLPALRFDSGMGRAGGAFALIYLVRRRGWKSHNWNPYCHPLPGWQAGKGASAPRKADLQPRQPGHGVVQTGSPAKRPDPRRFKEQTALSRCPQQYHITYIVQHKSSIWDAVQPGFDAKCHNSRTDPRPLLKIKKHLD